MHTFTIDYVPRKFLPFGLTTLMKMKYLRRPLTFLFANLNPFSSRDFFHRYSNFVKLSYKRKQKDIFDAVRSYYPLDTKFIVLPMDMAFMGAGDVPKDLDEQHNELADLRNAYPKQIIPFFAVDPRRKGVVEILKDYVENKDFKGIKIYPPLGYLTNHEILYEVYSYAEHKNIPIMTHCSRGGVRHKKLSKDLTRSYADPENYIQILKDFPKLKICLGHFGGDNDWKKYLDDPWDETSPVKSKSWLSKILDLIRSGEFPNLYTDISYTIFYYEDNSKVLKVLLESEMIRDKVLFGSDFYMVEQEWFLERKLSLYLRAILGEDLFWKIAEQNPEKYLGIATETQRHRVKMI
jgi:predicted TIM-barrel fold metal-dependent hydrolase